MDDKTKGYFLIIKDKLEESKMYREEALDKLENLSRLIREMKNMVEKKEDTK